MTDEKMVARGKVYRENQSKRGMKQIKVWVPESEIERFRALGQTVRDRHLRKLASQSKNKVK